jgi:hypothetical protein
LDTLVRLGFLRLEDAKAFDGVKVTFHSEADETRPEMMPVEALMPDGMVIAVMGDGSIQQFSGQRYEAYKKGAGENSQPNGAANRSHPVSPQTNSTPATAGSGR